MDSWNFEDELAPNQCDEKNTEIVLKMEEIEYSAKLSRKMKFHENQGSFELKFSIRDAIKSIIAIKI